MRILPSNIFAALYLGKVPVAVAALFLPNARGSEDVDDALSSAVGERGKFAGGEDGLSAGEFANNVDGGGLASKLSRRARLAQLLQRTGRQLRRSLVDLLRVLVNPLFVCATAGYAFVTFTLGALSFWMPAYEVEMYGMSLELASSSLGLSIIFSAIVSNIGVSLFYVPRTFCANPAHNLTCSPSNIN